MDEYISMFSLSNFITGYLNPSTLSVIIRSFPLNCLFMSVTAYPFLISHGLDILGIILDATFAVTPHLKDFVTI